MFIFIIKTKQNHGLKNKNNTVDIFNKSHKKYKVVFGSDAKHNYVSILALYSAVREYNASSLFDDIAFFTESD